MCAAVNSSLFLFVLTTVTITIMCGTKMATEGLPLYQHGQDRGADKGILAGSDFLSVFIGSSLRQAYRETTVSPTTIGHRRYHGGYIRDTRSTAHLTSPMTVHVTSTPGNPPETTVISAQLSSEQFSDSNNNSLSSDDGTSVARVTFSSVMDRTKFGDKQNDDIIEDTTIRESTTMADDQRFVASEEDQSSLVAEANKSDFSVEESEPITTNSDLLMNVRDFSDSVSGSYPASVQPLPRTDTHTFHPTSDYLTAHGGDENNKPFHQTVIFHTNSREPGRARSVSYSTVIQSVPNGNAPGVVEKTWDNIGDKHHERRERHYDGSRSVFDNNFERAKPTFNDTKSYGDASLMSNDGSWSKPQETTTRRSNSAITSERNWGSVEQPPERHNRPTIYGQPEQNYEVDESASVMTNGRVHGVQPSRSSFSVKSGQATKRDESKKSDDNQKVGYVVEGRNYRKYRVEERTSDGFIVGEYGVVSHNDGSLRGVRYTADGTINPRLIYDALMKFLSL